MASNIKEQINPAASAHLIFLAPFPHFTPQAGSKLIKNVPAVKIWQIAVNWLKMTDFQSM